MKKVDVTNFKIWCSEISDLFSRPKGISMPNKNAKKKYEKLINSDSQKTEDEIKFLREYDNQVYMYYNHPLSKKTMDALVRQYGRFVYNKKTASTGGDGMSFLKKGTDMEVEAVELLSKIDKTEYKLSAEKIENEYLVGQCDIICRDRNLIIDTKVSWNVNSFLKNRTSSLDEKYWYQMQGYMELYDVNEAEVVFLLLNTPPELIERERVKLLNRFMIGEIDRDKYDIDLDNIESAFTYNNTPLKKRYFRYRVKRDKGVIDAIYKKADKARLWVIDFEKQLKTNVLVAQPPKYFEQEEDNT